MQIRNPLVIVRKQISVMSGFMLTLVLVAAFNFAQVFYENYKAVSASGAHTYPDGMQMIVCYFGPPVGFYPRFLVFVLLFVACLSSFANKVRGKIISLIGVAGGLSVYIYWWVASYKIFKNFDNFLNSSEIRQVAYLYNGNWWDICLAVSLFVVLILQAESLVTRRLRVA